jgi:hypothetical protein
MAIVMIVVVGPLKRKDKNGTATLTGDEKIVMGPATTTVAPCP